MAYVVLLQGLVSAYANTMASTDPFGPGLVICAPSGKTDPLGKNPLEQTTKDCCGGLCKAAGSLGPVVDGPPAGLIIAFPIRVASDIPWSVEPSALHSRLYPFKEARGPPALSI